MLKILTNEENEFYQAIADEAFTVLKLKGEAAAELDIITKEEIQAVNKQTRNTDKPTDVLSFPFLEEITTFSKKNYPFDYDDDLKAVMAGSIIICGEIAREQAEEYGHSLSREYAYLFAHGLLHLLGFDHISEEDKLQMRKAEEAILKNINITRDNA